jgi:hypothetical protein
MKNITNFKIIKIFKRYYNNKIEKRIEKLRKDIEK